MNQEQHSCPKSKAWLVPKPKRIVTIAACIACRKRKSKCDGNRPTCTCCLKKRTPCIFDVKPNERPSQAMIRRNEEMQVELLNLRQLWTFLQSCTEQQMPQILRRIRAQSSSITRYQRSQDIAGFIRRQDFLGENRVENQVEDQTRTYPQVGRTVTLPSLQLALEQSGTVPAILSDMAGSRTSSISHRDTTER
ncbi:hypothetical protein BS50DRAFT_661043 [Corynespora cassiicola Philippines]|uniref:Zn(2)-C6 fungal-type domain-containing protein n=1 Tax=Corynespora cassiicola Philippines TaxID=1448308 RepID=A0A2T2N1C9_CORCC|nr:hypothetical protein BS50DRAFT_661043 [Corynespora cassiicola Philippines]